MMVGVVWGAWLWQETVRMGGDRDEEQGDWIGPWVWMRIVAGSGEVSLGIGQVNGSVKGSWQYRDQPVQWGEGWEQALSCYHAAGNYAGLGQAGT